MSCCCCHKTSLECFHCALGNSITKLLYAILNSMIMSSFSFAFLTFLSKLLWNLRKIFTNQKIQQSYFFTIRAMEHIIYTWGTWKQTFQCSFISDAVNVVSITTNFCQKLLCFLLFLRSSHQQNYRKTTNDVLKNWTFTTFFTKKLKSSYYIDIILTSTLQFSNIWYKVHKWFIFYQLYEKFTLLYFFACTSRTFYPIFVKTFTRPTSSVTAQSVISMNIL